jgi:hypothetical protein
MPTNLHLPYRSFGVQHYDLIAILPFACQAKSMSQAIGRAPERGFAFAPHDRLPSEREDEVKCIPANLIRATTMLRASMVPSPARTPAPSLTTLS